MISLDQEVRKAHNKIFYNAYREFYYNNELNIIDGVIKCTGNEALYVNDIKFMIERLHTDRWVLKDEFDNIILMNAYRLPKDETISTYPCIVEFDGELEGCCMNFTYRVIYETTPY